MNISRLDTYIKEKEHLQRLERTDIEALQLEKLNNVLKQEKRRQGFYGRLPEHIVSLKELQTLPFTTPSQLADQGTSMLLLSQAEIQRVITDQTSGTAGQAKRVFYTAADCKNTVEFFAAGLSEMVFSGGKTMICMPFSGPYGLGELVARAVEMLGAEPIKAGTGLTLGEYRDVIQHKKPDSFVGMPVQFLSILRYCGRGTLERALVSGDAEPEIVKKYTNKLDIRLFPHYGSREMALGGAVTCAAHEGMHLRENHIIAEIIDEKGKPLPAGEYGELVITTIGMEAMPLIRYRTGDVTRFLPLRCPCGSALTRMDSVVRKDDRMERLDNELFALNGLIDYCISVSPDNVKVIISACDTIETWRIQHNIESVFPNSKLYIETRGCRPVDRLFYTGKRVILKGKSNTTARI